MKASGKNKQDLKCSESTIYGRSKYFYHGVFLALGTKYLREEPQIYVLVVFG